jgi:glutaredoxin
VPTARTMPQIFINDQYVGGLSELRRYILDN